MLIFKYIKKLRDMKLNGGLLSEGTSEYVKLRKAWKAWNAKCHPEDQIDWEDYYDEHKK